eukprot:1858752-Prymnesium_polylepis.1
MFRQTSGVVVRLEDRTAACACVRARVCGSGICDSCATRVRPGLQCLGWTLMCVWRVPSSHALYKDRVGVFAPRSPAWDRF